ncbi:deoxycytidine deaminase [Streptomyces luomodiensis]|uniref:Deoxycytidine deaminase n=1 Tax=Streptomyces luomodiensis TaxID=3026192 RepID=A0ABY9USG9_9ACTN|nr:deoxycytidine deaminase [Streptomyces sp. SCA4-21]WNE95503.1 deoxycytidine deaminase [Streptomyces sp. SCA4-21]
MILTGSRITQAVADGDIVIDPFDESAVNPNSYNYRIGPTIRTYDEKVVDAHSPPATEEQTIPAGGLVLQPSRVYLATTKEVIGSDRFVPSLIGRSSLGRLGVFLQISADLGNLGAVHRWTLEITVCQPVHIVPDMIMGQVSFWVPRGERTPYKGYFGNFSTAVLPEANHFA